MRSPGPALLFSFFVSAFGAPGALAASSFSPDATDLWWNPNESGWGMNIVQQAGTLFATLFVYGNDGRAHWYVAPNIGGASANTPTDQLMMFNGTLYETTGPALGTTFDPAAIGVRAVGAITLQYARPNGMSVDYTVDGVKVSKFVVRQTWAANDISGEYNATRVLRARNCPAFPMETVDLGVMRVDLSGSSVTITTQRQTPAFSCTYTGTYSQAGHMGSISGGSYSCSDGTSGAFSIDEIEVSMRGFLGYYHASERGCSVYGHLGGTRTTIFGESE